MPARGQHTHRLRASPEFAKLCQGFHQDRMINISTLDALANDVLRHISTKDIRPLKVFLDHLLDGTFAASELRGFMNRSTPNFSWHNSKGVVELLSHVRTQLDTLAT